MGIQMNFCSNESNGNILSHHRTICQQQKIGRIFHFCIQNLVDFCVAGYIDVFTQRNRLSLGALECSSEYLMVWLRYIHCTNDMTCNWLLKKCTRYSLVSRVKAYSFVIYNRSTVSDCNCGLLLLRKERASERTREFVRFIYHRTYNIFRFLKEKTKKFANQVI